MVSQEATRRRWTAPGTCSQLAGQPASSLGDPYISFHTLLQGPNLSEQIGCCVSATLPRSVRQRRADEHSAALAWCTLERMNPFSIANQSIGIAIAAPEVIAHRMLRMMLAGKEPSKRDRAEFDRMSSEKVAAFYESWNAMFAQMARANMRLMLSPMWWARPSPGNLSKQFAAHARQAALATIGAGLAPVHRRAASNAKRLRRVGFK